MKIYSQFYHPTPTNFHCSVSFSALASNSVKMFVSLSFLFFFFHITFINIFTAYYIIFYQCLLYYSIKYMSHNLDKHHLVEYEGKMEYSFGSILINHGTLWRDASDNMNVLGSFQLR